VPADALTGARSRGGATALSLAADRSVSTPPATCLGVDDGREFRRGAARLLQCPHGESPPALALTTDPRPLRACVGGDRDARCPCGCGSGPRRSPTSGLALGLGSGASLSRLGGVPSLKLALWPTVPAEEAVVRRGATSATRQRTIEANGIDRGASCSRRGPGCGERPGDSVLGVLVGAGGDETGVLAKEPGVPTTA
jgi:hypothetical protein